MTPIYGAVNKKVFAAQARRGQQIVENIFNQMRADLGEFYLWPDVTTNAFYEEFEKRLRVEPNNIIQGQYPYDPPFGGGRRYLLKNGMILLTSIYAYNDPVLTGKVLLIAFDTNGIEGPNRNGVDMFAMSFNKNPNNTELHPYGIFPAGYNYPSDDATLTSGCRDGGAHSWYFFPTGLGGNTCLVYLSRNNYKMDKNYPIKNFSKRR